MWLLKLSLLVHLLLSPGVVAAPTVRRLEKRHSDCWGSNVQGCSYSTAGYSGAAVSEVGTCSSIGVDIMAQGGNAADAMIASSLCVGTINAYHSGIGGGGFMLVRFYGDDGTPQYEMIDFRETMPAAGNETMYSQYGENQTQSTVGGLAVGVPGEMRGWKALHDRHGLLPWAQLFAPAIDLARNGFPVNPDLADAIQDRPFILEDPLFAEVYAPNGTLLGVGDRCYRKKFAYTLEALASEGADLFYANSSIAANIIKAVQERGGIMTADDLAGYETIIREPAMIEYRDKKVISTVAPSSGSVVLSTLQIFSEFDGSAQDDDPAINLTTHRLIESTKFAYGQRATLGDPAFTANVSSLEKAYITEDVASQARGRISDEQTFESSYYDPSGYFPSQEFGTSYLATVDGNGMAVSLTTTVNLYWGSQVMTYDGIILNNEMDDFGSPGQVNAFGFASSPINFIEPGKRPLSSISSSIVEDKETGEFVMATGSAGGSQIITATIQQLYHFIDQGLNASGSTRHPRWHDQLNGMTNVELPQPNDFGLDIPGYDNATVAFLESLGHNITYVEPGGSTSSAIGRLLDGRFLASAETRRPAAYGAAF